MCTKTICTSRFTTQSVLHSSTCQSRANKRFDALAIGTHHLEYGFPSTHSTNSVSIALFLFSHIYSLYTTPATIDPSFVNVDSTHEMMLSRSTFILATSLLTFYVFSIVYGRLYTAMHSFTDCIFGVLLGTAIWWAETYTYGPTNTWLRESGLIGECFRIVVRTEVDGMLTLSLSSFRTHSSCDNNPTLPALSPQTPSTC